MKKIPTLFALAVASAAVVWAANNEPPSGTESKNTIITSDGPLEMHNNGEDSYSVFSVNVRLTGTNLEVTCDKLEIFADQKGDSKATIGKLGAIRRILATGHVVITQQGRRATCGRAEVLPREDKIVLTEEPVLTDFTGTMTGERVTFLRGEQTAIIDKPRVVGPPMKNLGFAPQPSDAAAAPAKDSGTPPSTSPAPGG